MVLGPPRLVVPGNQPDGPLTGIAAVFHPLTGHHFFSRVGKHQIAEFNRSLLNPAVAGGLVAEDREGYLLAH